ncbi:hypothetical protein FLX56_02620 [Synechococcus moorigangaii CMS01]|nr:hypothetical protein [Synechococcus moorigangaii CMS01]
MASTDKLAFHPGVNGAWCASVLITLSASPALPVPDTLHYLAPRGRRSGNAPTAFAAVQRGSKDLPGRRRGPLIRFCAHAPQTSQSGLFRVFPPPAGVAGQADKEP